MLGTFLPAEETNDEPVNRSNKGFWLWVVVLFVALVILAWLFRFPWA